MRYLCFAMFLFLAACNASAGSTINLVTPTVQSSPTNLVTPTVQSSPTIAATQTAIFGREIGMGGYPAITLEEIGNIPANTRVNITSAMLEDEWIYQIVDNTGNYADARESQLVFAPDVTPGAPTPTSAFADLLSQGTVYARTLADAGNIPAGTIVQISGSYYGDGELVYLVGNVELGLSGEIPQSQLEVVDFEAYDWITVVPSATPQ